MRQKLPYRLYFKTLTTGGKMWYYTAYDKAGKRHAYSTGCRNRNSAEKRVMDIYLRGELIPEEVVRIPTFREFSHHWWIWGKCPYTSTRLDNGYEIGEDYVKTNHQVLHNRLLPFFGDTPLDEITVAMVEKWTRLLVTGVKKKNGEWKTQPVSNKSARNYLSVLSVMLGEAVRLGHIEKNPCKSARSVAKNSRVRGTLTVAEAKAVLSSPSLWYNEHAYIASMLAAVTGMRLSEIRALRVEDVKDDHIHVERSLSDSGIKSTKTGDVRDLPIPDKVMGMLHKAKMYRDEGFLLCYPDGRPYGRHVFLDNLHDALEKIEVDWKTRNIGFHSWRHFLNTQLLAHGITGEKTREITGHATEQMTQRYKHFSKDDYADILEVTGEIV